VTGQTVDTNAAWLSTQLQDMGFTVLEHRAIRDVALEISAATSLAVGRADLVLWTGGLGPTSDDLTTESVAAALGLDLSLDPVALQAIEDRFASMRRPMAPSNRKQAMLPNGATRLDNDRGTAPGFRVRHGGSWIACMPGVPSEMRPMFSRLVPWLHTEFGLESGRLVTLRTFGIPESRMQQRVGGASLAGVELGYRCDFKENQLKLRASSQVDSDTLRAFAVSLAKKLGKGVFAIDGLSGTGFPSGDHIDVIAAALTERGQTLATAESCTGGRIASRCTERPGSSGWYLEGAVTYSNAAKSRQLGIPPALIAEHGAVSEPVVCAMARGIQHASGATWALATSGIAGPGGAVPGKPVGTVHIALAGPDNLLKHRLLHLPGTRDRVTSLSSGAALDLLRRALYPSPPVQ